LTLEAAYTAFSFFSQASTSVRRMPASALSSNSGSRCFLDVTLVVLHGRGGQVLGLVPAVRVLAEGLLAKARVAPLTAPDSHLFGVCGLLGLALGGELDHGTCGIGNRAVLAFLDLVSAAPVAAALLCVPHGVPSLLSCGVR
jgi:hypothetical protein